eukprot:8411944-Alexandrium_andersonii.AAC.1
MHAPCLLLSVASPSMQTSLPKTTGPCTRLHRCTATSSEAPPQKRADASGVVGSRWEPTTQ